MAVRNGKDVAPVEVSNVKSAWWFQGLNNVWSLCSNLHLQISIFQFLITEAYGNVFL